MNRRAVVAADRDLVLHAGCVAHDGRAIVVSGASGTGTWRTCPLATTTGTNSSVR